MFISFYGNFGPENYHSISSDPNVNELDQLYQLLSGAINEYGRKSSPRGKESKEILDASFFLQDPRNRVITSPIRNIKPRYLVGEFIWYLSGELEVSRIIRYSKFWQNLADKDGKVVSNYGERCLYSPEMSKGQQAGNLLSEDSQFIKVAKELISDPDSRRAIVNIHDTRSASMNPSDVPCTLTLQFFIRDKKLHLSVNMRSNDIVLGFGNDIFQFTMLQELMLSILNVMGADLDLGYYHHHAGSLHVYDNHYDMVRTEAFREREPEPGLRHKAYMKPFPRFNSIAQIRSWIYHLVSADSKKLSKSETFYGSMESLDDEQERHVGYLKGWIDR